MPEDKVNIQFQVSKEIEQKIRDLITQSRAKNADDLFEIILRNCAQTGAQPIMFFDELNQYKEVPIIQPFTSSPPKEPSSSKSEKTAKKLTARELILKFFAANPSKQATQGEIAEAIHANETTIRRTIQEMVVDGVIEKVQGRAQGKRALFALPPPPPSRNPFVGETGDGMHCERCGKNTFRHTGDTTVNGEKVEVWNCTSCGFSKRV